MTRSSDGVVPVTFPVVFPLGVENGVKNFTAETQPKWVSTGYWSRPSQPQAYCQWNKVSDPSDKYQQKLETVNDKDGKISSPGVKGVWTGDNFEFVIPVKKFAAGKYLPAKGSWSSILLDGTHELITHKRNSTDGKNVGVILCKLALNHRIAPSDASDVDNGWLAEICVPRSSVKVVDGKVKVNLALFDMEGGEDAIVSTGEKNPQKWITVTGL